MYSRIAGIGGYLPEKTVTNDDLSKDLDTSHEWIFTRTGICERRIAREDEKSSDMGYMAAVDAMRDAGIDACDIGMIVVATTTPDTCMPSVATKIEARLGARDAFSFDISAACSGFVYAMSIADRYVSSGVCDTALIIGAEKMSRVVDWSDRRTAVLFGDGAGAVVLQRSDKPGIVKTVLHSDGRGHDALYVGSDGFVHMNGQEVFKAAVIGMEKIYNELMEDSGYTASDIKFFIPHQANKRIVDAVASRAGISPEKIIQTSDIHANTSAASIPLAMWMVKDKISRGDVVILEAFGAGFTSGGTLLVY